MTIEILIASSDLRDPAVFEALLSGVPDERRTRCSSYRRLRERQSCVVSFALLRHLWWRRAGGPLPGITVGRFGKPEFAETTDGHFNLSHDGSVCLCAVASVPVGVDVQGRVPFDGWLFDRIAANSELRFRDWLRGIDDLAPLWTRKEAAAKRSGSGLSIALREIDTASVTDIVTFFVEELQVWVSVCSDGLDGRSAASLSIEMVRPGNEPDTWFGTPVTVSEVELDGLSRSIAPEEPVHRS